jgi:hypothetical protein
VSRAVYMRAYMCVFMATFDVLYTDLVSDQSAQSGGKVLVIGLGRDEQTVGVVFCAATVH